MKQAIVVLAFGTSAVEVRERDITPVVAHIREAFPTYDTYEAFTSRFIVRRLRSRGLVVETEEEVIARLIEAGYEEIIVQPLHIVGGEEFEKLRARVMAFEGQGQCKRIAVGRPLLVYAGQEDCPDDFAVLAEKFIKPLQIPADEGLLFVGHGGVNVGNHTYSALQLYFLTQNMEQVRVATIEGFPTLDAVALPWAKFGTKEVKRIHVHPLLLVAGDHAVHDIFGDDGEECFVSQLRDAGYEVVEHRRGLGSYLSIRDIYVQHTKEAIADGQA